MSDEGQPAASEDAVLGWASVGSDTVITDAERVRRRAEIAEKAERARQQMTQQSVEVVGSLSLENARAVAELREASANQQAMLDEIFEVMGEVVDARTPAASRRPHLRLVRPDERDAG